MISNKQILAAAFGGSILIAAIVVGLAPVESEDLPHRPVIEATTEVGTKPSLRAPRKPQPPMQITSSLDGNVDPATEYEVVLTFLPTADCSRLQTEVRGLEGLVVESAGVRAHEGCHLGKPVLRKVQVRAPAGVAGYLVADADFVSGERRLLATQMFAIHAKGAVRKLEPAGRVRVDTTGQPLVIMKSAAPADR